ncbi:alpha/beta fold hydrolase [Teredinibacter turnerae]|uniref:alpha/beta fold hydrolase n=1 Tax=Teredinibacter turnerae TaxID=2426 RepID=UPI0004147DB7|nr:alpha/beta hydrolase [Teredinibacter turnerae]
MPYAYTQDNTRIFFETYGSGAPLLLIPGQGLDHKGWGSFVNALAEQFRVIVLDNRGTGNSDKPDAPEYTTRGMAADAIAVLNTLQIFSAHVLGFSMGGRIAQWVAVDHPKRVNKLVLVATTPGNTHGVARAQSVDFIFASGNRERMLELMVSPGWYDSNPEFQQLWQYQAENRPPAYAQRLHFVASECHDCWHELSSVTTPTLIVHGNDDTINVPANARLLAEQIPEAEVVFIPEGRHYIFLEKQDECSEAILQFLGKS